MAMFTCEVREIELPAGRCVRIARWRNAEGVAVRFALTTGFQADRDSWERSDAGIELPPGIIADVARVLLELAGA